MRYSLVPAEEIRKRLGLTPDEFSVRLEYNWATYPAAVKRGYITRRMALEISRRFGIPMGRFKEGDGEN